MSAPNNLGNVVPFCRPQNPLAFAPGVPPFNPADPKHVALWNAAVKYGQSEYARKGC
jgi:hypothetical protein